MVLVQASLQDEKEQRQRAGNWCCGGSNAKVVYRSKEEYKDGQPLDDKYAENGILHMDMLPRTQLNDIISLIKEKCDITRDPDTGLADVCVTGLGGNFNKEMLENELKLRITVMSEMELFSRVFAFLSQHKDSEQLFEAFSKKGLERGKKLMDVSLGFTPFLGAENIPIDVDYSLPSDWFPCLIIICGSGNVVLKVERDGSFKLVDFLLLGSRFLQGFSAICCGVQTYTEMDELIGKSDGKTVDVYVSDEVTKVKQESDKDAYNAIYSDDYDIRLLPFGKGQNNPAEATKGDLLYSMQRNVADTLARAVFHSTFRAKTRHVFFVGNFVSSPRIQEWMTEMMHYQNTRITPDERVNFRFVKNGGFLGAMGGYMYKHKQ